MLTLLFVVLVFIIFGKLLMFALKASWGLIKILFSIVFLPLILIALLFMGLTYLALPILVIAGVISIVKS
ncbi:MAG: hypothetical protein HFJ10_06965 [Lachnospiraceae bacterium]|nr:hypothetical protein [Lachnospiraceae bacterium]